MNDFKRGGKLFLQESGACTCEASVFIISDQDNFSFITIHNQRRIYLRALGARAQGPLTKRAPNHEKKLKGLDEKIN